MCTCSQALSMNRRRGQSLGGQTECVNCLSAGLQSKTLGGVCKDEQLLMEIGIEFRVAGQL